MEARTGNPGLDVPGAMEALTGLAKSVQKGGLDHTLAELVDLRASQINGCSVCVTMHTRNLRKTGESEDRIWAVAAWRDAPFFTDAERAALALAEAVTRISDRANPVPDAVWDEATRHYDEQALAALVIAIANINLWNRLNVATAQVAGTYEW